jgi:hypothetical protein
MYEAKRKPIPKKCSKHLEEHYQEDITPSVSGETAKKIQSIQNNWSILSPFTPLNLDLISPN